MSYSYNELARQVSTSYGGAVTTVTSDYLGRKVAMSDADMGAWSYTYDALNLTAQTDARGCTTGLSYDLLNRLTSKTYSGAPTECNNTPDVLYGYDGLIRTDSFDGSSLPYAWTSSGSVVIGSGVATLTGNGSWSTSLARSEVLGDQRTGRFSFKVNSTTAVGNIFYHAGTWGQSSYRRWGISINGGYIKSGWYEGTSSGSTNLVQLQANVWYDAEIVLNGGEYIVRVWKQDTPGTVYERAEPHSTWTGAAWKFNNQWKTAVGTFDDYQEFNPANSLGRRTLMKTTTSTWTTETAAAWFYDQRGRVVSESRMIAGSGTFLTQWGYNSGDMLSWIKYPGDNLGGSGEQVNYTYLPQGALLQVTNATKYALNMQYDAAGRLTSITRGVDILNTAYAYYPWDIQGGRLKTIKTGTGTPVTPTLQSFEYDYDPNGNLDWIKDYLAAGGTQTQTFHYDELNRLKDAQASGGTDGTYVQQVYNYDSATGNLSSKAGVGYTYNAQVSCAAGSRTIPHAASAMGSNEYSYDCNGNMTYRDIDNICAYTLVYDAENRLVTVSGAASATFVYDGDGKRVKATVNGTETAYVGNYYEWSNNSWTKYYYAGTTRVAMRTSSSLYYLLGDHLGSTWIVATSTGVKYSESRYMPWGEDRYTSTTPPPTAYLYTGQKLESPLLGSGIRLENSAPSQTRIWISS